MESIVWDFVWCVKSIPDTLSKLARLHMKSYLIHLTSIFSLHDSNKKKKSSPVSLKYTNKKRLLIHTNSMNASM